MWKEIIFTVIVIWVLFRLFGRRVTVVHHHNTFTQNNYSKQEEKRKEEVKIDYIPEKNPQKERDKGSEGEYVDFEEVK